MTAAARTTAGNVLALGELKHTHTPRMRERNVGAMVLPAIIIAIWLFGVWTGGLQRRPGQLMRDDAARPIDADLAC